MTMFALAYAFWKHSWKHGILVINLIAILKVLWSLCAGDGSGVSIVLPASIGLVICNLFIWIAYKVVKQEIMINQQIINFNNLRPLRDKNFIEKVVK
ncbi:hypothetical protein F8163_26900 [Bacillus luti]|uniref:Uncharacterized protein n=1 Tax=Bacillus luti TaxID=2026191 RepID=A0A7V7S2B9_9BACI|nr:hypothetical protein F8163_26900 [Bacillus luti]